MRMGVPGVAFTTKEANEHVKRKHDQSGAYEPLTNCIHVARKSEVKEDDGRSENGNRKRMAQCIEQPKPHAFAPRALYAGDIGDCGKMVVIEAMPEPEQSAGEQSEFERRRHPLVGYELRESGATEAVFRKPDLTQWYFLWIEFVLDR